MVYFFERSRRGDGAWDRPLVFGNLSLGFLTFSLSTTFARLRGGSVSITCAPSEIFADISDGFEKSLNNRELDAAPEGESSDTSANELDYLDFLAQQELLVDPQADLAED
ncbi:hypothetical protein GGX14DRAFT_401997 [Mycena pura]|uniref:Uncharacterized protein n=1 Tax=Mycena pura TaxID=153505 RepID=A0AAD6UZ84_9AGAR|nr:hypothetical protein GGX14DRAFT_401997 [Mycena pura]